MLKLNPETEQRVAQKVRSGFFRTEDDVVIAGLDLLEQQEQDRQDVQRAIAEAEADRQRGAFVSPEESRRRIRAVIERYRPKQG